MGCRCAGNRGRTLLAALGIAVTLTGSALAESVTVTDGLGRTVSIASPPQRIVTIFASNTEIAAALGLTDRIVGIESYTRYPPEVLQKPLVGGRLGFSVDAVVAQRPDLVVVTPSRQAAQLLVDPMQRLQIPILVFLQRTVAEIFDNIRVLARAAGIPSRGEQVSAALAQRLDRVRMAVEHRSAPRVVMVTGRLGNGLLLITRPNTYTGDAIVKSGGTFALPDASTIPQVSPEALLTADPDVLLFAGSKAGLDDLIQSPGWSRLRAVRTGAAYPVSRAEFLIPGPRTLQGIEHLAALLHPDAFAR